MELANLLAREDTRRSAGATASSASSPPSDEELRRLERRGMVARGQWAVLVR